jgi:protein tyrosine/serine phosphatase
MRTVLVCVPVLLVFFGVTHLMAASPNKERSANWAQPITLEGVPNLHKVSADLYRSAQPTAEGMRNLRRMGIETMVSLRSFHSDLDKIGYTGLAYEQIYMKAWHPEEKEVIRFLQIVSNPRRAPVLVHCQHGSDRTGMMCAMYRIVAHQWTKEEAIREMIDGGYGFHEVWANIVPWINKLDVERIRKEAGL